MDFMREKDAPYRTHDGGFCRCYFDEHFTASAVAYCVRAAFNLNVDITASAANILQTSYESCEGFLEFSEMI